MSDIVLNNKGVVVLATGEVYVSLAAFAEFSTIATKQVEAAYAAEGEAFHEHGIPSRTAAMLLASEVLRDQGANEAAEDLFIRIMEIGMKTALHQLAGCDIFASAPKVGLGSNTSIH